MLLVSIIFGAFIIVRSANDLRVCNDCTSIRQCPQAMRLITTNRSQITIQKIRNATCSIGKDLKICCTDLFDGRLDEIKNAWDEIENHPNIHLLPTECGQIPSSRLLGGFLRSQYDFPWLVLIANRGPQYVKFECEGTLINSKYVLTTAHCIKNKHILGVRVVNNTPCFGRIDFWKCKLQYQDIGVELANTHEDYSLHPVPVNNIALLRLTRPVDFSDNNIRAVCLPVFSNLFYANLQGNNGTVASWSRKGDDLTSNMLLSTTLPILNPVTCRFYFHRYLKYNLMSHVEQILCAGELGHDTWIEGEGVPLMLEGEYNNTYKYIQYGIQSYGPTRRGVNSPEIYTDIRKFMKWILDFIKP